MKVVETVGNCSKEEIQLCHNCKVIDPVKATTAERFCITCEEKLCISCCQEHKTQREHLVVALERQEEAKQSKKPEFCADHEDACMLPELYCICCREVICSECKK